MNSKNCLWLLLGIHTGIFSSPVDDLKDRLNIDISQASVSKDGYCHLYFIRHGHTDWSIEKLRQGWTDIPLNERGRKQMGEAAEHFKNLNISVIYSSDLQRASESAQVLGETLHCKTIMIDAAFRGENQGEFEGLKLEEYGKSDHFIYFASLTREEEVFFPFAKGGESLAELSYRLIPCLKTVCYEHLGENVIIVVHGGVLKLLHFLLGEFDAHRIAETKHAEILQLDGDGFNFFKVINS